MKTCSTLKYAVQDLKRVCGYTRVVGEKGGDGQLVLSKYTCATRRSICVRACGIARLLRVQDCVWRERAMIFSLFGVFVLAEVLRIPCRT